jgi:hypothetical protein
MALKRNLSPSTLMRCGMFFLILFALAQRSLGLQMAVGDAWADGIRGFLMSMSGGLNLLSVVKRRQASC